MKNIKDIPFDQLLIDIHPKTGNVIKWSEKKKQTEEMAIGCQRLATKDLRFERRAGQLLDCGEYLEFLVSTKTDEKRLHRAFFCRYRLCPMCSWRRSLKNYGQLSKIMDVCSSQGYRYLFSTMSVKNCSGLELKSQISALFKGYTNLIRRKAVNNCVLGSMRTLEVTHNVNPTDTCFDTYNAHIHAIFVVKPSYFKKGYIKQAQWLEYWKKAMKVSYEPHFHIKAVKKGKDGGAIREVSKYATKPGQILTQDHELTDSAIFYLDQALANRRLVSYTGILKKIKADLRLDDVENGDLVNVDGNQDLNKELDWTIQRYQWGYGYSQYLKCK